jgi:hypothetical protein
MRALLLLFVLGACARAAHADAPPRAPATAMKGWALYTWFDLACSASPQLRSAPNDDSWCVALVVGTNRARTATEIKRAAQPWRTAPALLARLAKGEEVAWMTAPGFEAPAAPLRTVVVDAARRRGLILRGP